MLQFFLQDMIDPFSMPTAICAVTCPDCGPALAIVIGK
jgi:hypothetical protein